MFFRDIYRPGPEPKLEKYKKRLPICIKRIEMTPELFCITHAMTVPWLISWIQTEPTHYKLPQSVSIIFKTCTLIHKWLIISAGNINTYLEVGLMCDIFAALCHSTVITPQQTLGGQWLFLYLFCWKNEINVQGTLLRWTSAPVSYI